MNIFIDTNIFLEFYHYTQDDIEELKKIIPIIEREDNKLFLTQQVVDEFYRNREKKLMDAIKTFEKETIHSNFPQICRAYEEFPAMVELQREYKKHKNSLVNKIMLDIKNNTLVSDKIIESIFEKITVINISKISFKNARYRNLTGNPPGKNNSIGDAINWELLLENVPNGEDLHLIANDKDYNSIIDTDDISPVLLKEWESKKESKIHYYRKLSDFFNEHFPSIKLANEIGKQLDMKKLILSGSFSSTHNAISKLSKYSEFTVDETNELLRAFVENSQINLIYTDSDVKDFFDGLISGREHEVDREICGYFQSEISPVTTYKINDEIPF